MAFYNRISDRTNFVISFTSDPKGDFAVFSEGYAMAASTLAKRLMSQQGFRDYEYYPVVFLYRHALELSLKSVIYATTRLFSARDREAFEDKLHITHNLQKLSIISMRFLASAYPGDPFVIALADEVLKVGKEFTEIDNDSFSYRYPVTTKGEPSTKHHQVTNMRSICEVLDPLLEKLKSIDFGISMEINTIVDMQRSLGEL